MCNQPSRPTQPPIDLIALISRIGSSVHMADASFVSVFKRRFLQDISLNVVFHIVVDNGINRLKT